MNRPDPDSDRAPLDAPPRRTVARSIIEQHAQSVLLALITAALLYSGNFVLQAREEAARMSTQLGVLTAEVSAVRVQLSTLQSTYIGRDEFRDHESRLRSLEASNRSRP